MVNARKRKSVREESLALQDARIRANLRQQRVDLQQQINRLRALRNGAIERARFHCASSRLRLKKRTDQIRKEALAAIAKLTAPARAACKERIAKARQTGRTEEERLRAEQRAVRSFEQQVFRTATKYKRERAKRPRETDSDVRRNLEPELYDLWTLRAKATKGSRLKSRTEEFLQWVEEHPESVATELTSYSEKQVAKEIAAHARAQDKLARLLSKQGVLTARELAAAGVDVHQCNSMGLDCHQHDDLQAYLESIHSAAASGPEPWETTP